MGFYGLVKPLDCVLFSLDEFGPYHAEIGGTTGYRYPLISEAFNEANDGASGVKPFGEAPFVAAAASVLGPPRANTAARATKRGTPALLVRQIWPYWPAGEHLRVLSWCVSCLRADAQAALLHQSFTCCHR